MNSTLRPGIPLNIGFLIFLLFRVSGTVLSSIAMVALDTGCSSDYVLVRFLFISDLFTISNQSVDNC